MRRQFLFLSYFMDCSSPTPPPSDSRFHHFILSLSITICSYSNICYHSDFPTPSICNSQLTSTPFFSTLSLLSATTPAFCSLHSLSAWASECPIKISSVLSTPCSPFYSHLSFFETLPMDHEHCHTTSSPMVSPPVTPLFLLSKELTRHSKYECYRFFGSHSLRGLGWTSSQHSNSSEPSRETKRCSFLRERFTSSD